MHLVSLSFLAAFASSLTGLRRLRAAPRHDAVPRGIETLKLAKSLRVFCFGVGALGSLMLAASVLHGAGTASETSVLKYAAMSLHPVVWALSLVCPLSLLVAIRRHSHLRQRAELSA